AGSPTTPCQGATAGVFPTFGSFFDDVDGDGALDLFALIDTQQGWFAWGVPGDAPSFARDERLTASLGATDAMSLSPLDFDRDGRIDYFLGGSPYPGNRLLRNRAPRELPDLAAKAGLAPSATTSWGSRAFDANLDGWPDLLVLQKGGVPPDVESPAPPMLWLNQR